MNEFDHRPDSALGDALRDAFSLPDDAAFVRRVMQRVPQTIVAETWLDVLGRWARPGLAAAAVALVAVTVWLSGQPALDASPEEAVAAPEILSTGQLLASQPLPEFRVELVLGEDRVNE
jgi:hypothetical protein